ncbi:TetR/AcrR family transcriptional regulator [Saccharothrix sp.]|uniref:TetR/AcrR family transcriptional regulator n=1 Tax=Saccharothrix sp. TaxID=1873460 RepID=UPI0028118135|nr:TetR/AcrR family transcriptional regulator [Saccharothrix sp.]
MPRLTHARVVDAAVRVADRGGLTQVSMRNVGKELGVEAMSLYHHVKGKDALLDALADWIFVRIDLPDPATPWRAAMTTRAASARAVLSEHSWGLGLIESRRSPGPASLRHHDAVLGCLRHNGFSVGLAASAFSVLDAYVYGFVLTELNLPFQAGESAEEFVAQVDLPADQYPHLTEMVAEQILDRDYSYGDEFTRGLDLILDSLEARLAAAR